MLFVREVLLSSSGVDFTHLVQLASFQTKFNPVYFQKTEWLTDESFPPSRQSLVHERADHKNKDWMRENITFETSRVSNVLLKYGWLRHFCAPLFRLLNGYIYKTITNRTAIG